MKELNNLIGAVGNIPSDTDIFEKYGKTIEEFKDINEDILLRYIQGLVEMSMCDLDFSDRDIEFVIDEVREHLLNDRAGDIITWEWTHTFEV